MRARICAGHLDMPRLRMQERLQDGPHDGPTSADHERVPVRTQDRIQPEGRDGTSRARRMTHVWYWRTRLPERKGKAAGCSSTGASTARSWSSTTAAA